MFSQSAAILGHGLLGAWVLLLLSDSTEASGVWSGNAIGPNNKVEKDKQLETGTYMVSIDQGHAGSVAVSATFGTASIIVERHVVVDGKGTFKPFYKQTGLPGLRPSEPSVATVALPSGVYRVTTSATSTEPFQRKPVMFSITKPLE